MSSERQKEHMVLIRAKYLEGKKEVPLAHTEKLSIETTNLRKDSSTIKSTYFLNFLFGSMFVQRANK